MPAFILISGFFAKGSTEPKYIKNLIKKLLLPYLLTKKQLMFLEKSTMRIITLSTMVTMAVLIYTLPDFNSGWLLASKSYSHLGLPNAGVLARFLVYFTSSLIVMSFFSWVPSRKFSFTYIGERTLYTYCMDLLFNTLKKQIYLT